QTNILGALVAHVLQKRQAAGQQQFGDLFDQPGLLHAVGDFRDHDLVGAAAAVLGLPSRADAEAAAAGGVGLDRAGGVVHQDAAGGEIGAGHEADQVLAGGVGMGEQV